MEARSSTPTSFAHSSSTASLFAHACSLKRNNALTALLCGALPALLLAVYLPPRPYQWLIGLGIGLVWANAFEYFYHRYLLHHTRGALGKGHILHHITSGKENEVEHLTFGESPLYVMLLFSTNGSPVILADLLWGFALAPGILLGFTAYFIAVEEIHWRIHLGGWLPPLLRAARPYHLDHHDIPEGRYNVFCPFFDLLLGTAKSSSEATPAPRPRRNIWRALQEEALLYTWIIGMAVFIRYFCGGSPRS
ncbi:MAG TPA: sterol desaturase family protein [Terriglobales bacterium]|nr:sterol desaturase family protein [Terriglobales bacterium]